MRILGKIILFILLTNTINLESETIDWIVVKLKNPNIKNNFVNKKEFYKVCPAEITSPWILQRLFNEMPKLGEREFSNIQIEFVQKFKENCAEITIE